MFFGEPSQQYNEAGKMRFILEFLDGKFSFDLFTQPTAETSLNKKAGRFLFAHSFHFSDQFNTIKHPLIEPNVLIIRIWVPLIRIKLLFSAK